MQETDLPATNAFEECKFLCTNGNCLRLGSLICNQLNNCGDNSDEENCPVVTQHPPPGIFNAAERQRCVCARPRRAVCQFCEIGIRARHELIGQLGRQPITMLSRALPRAELEFVQIVIIIVVMTVMVVVIICLLNHYKLSTWSFITRQSQARRHDHALQQDGCLWPSDSSSRQGASEVLYAPQARDRFTAPSFMQRDRFSRFQPTYPYLQHQIDLPPTISLSDGEEPPPYQGPCTLQLRDPEQQMELNRESVRAPPNRTIYDSDLIDMGGGGGLLGVGGGGGGPRPPSSNSGISVANSSSHGRMEGPPPAYSEVMGHYPGSAFFLHQHSNNQRVGGPGSRTIQQQSQSESTIAPAKAKDGQPEDLV